MALLAGTIIGPYEVVSLLGAGGMGEVYRARDPRLSRDVALKILPEHFALDPDRLDRFRREAQLLASLNHPHIGQIYGLEHVRATSAPATDTQALVLELVDARASGRQNPSEPVIADSLYTRTELGSSWARPIPCSVGGARSV